MKLLAEEMKNHLENVIIPFWESIKDNENGGFYGYLDFDLNIQKDYEKSCILNSRILWFFSNAYLTLKNETLLIYADYAYEFMKNFMIDKELGGVYWTVDFKGNPIDTTKHTYNQAFAIYALSSYYRARNKQEALDIALDLFEIVESKHIDKFGYVEALSKEYKLEKNDKLSENGVIAEKTMNTLLHVFEAYTELYRVTKKDAIAKSLKKILDIFEDKVYNADLKRQEVFFDNEWNSLINLHSYGHDIETAWLVDLGLEVLNDNDYKNSFKEIIENLTQNVYENAYKDNSILNECENGIDDTRRVWWVQSEAIVGFLNGYSKDKANTHYLDAAKNIWEYIKENIVDKRENAEWFWYVDENKVPSKDPIVEPWKCPYHNGRMCFEVIRRASNE